MEQQMLPGMKERGEYDIYICIMCGKTITADDFDAQKKKYGYRGAGYCDLCREHKERRQ